MTSPASLPTGPPTAAKAAGHGPAIPASNPDLGSAIAELEKCDPGYRKAGRYYAGEVSEVFASNRMRRAMQRSGLNFTFNFARMPVDALAERVALSAVTAEPKSAQDALEEVWRRNKMKLTAKQIHREAFKYGDAYAIVWPDPDDESKIDIFYNSPHVMRVFYDEENPRKKRYAVKKWKAGGVVRANLYYEDRIEKYRQVDTGTQKVWVQWRDEESDTWPYDNPYGELPVFHFRTDDPHGRPEHRDFYGPQDAIHKLIVSHMSSVDFSAWPQRYALREADADTSEAADIDEDAFAFGTETGSTSTSRDEGRSQLRADPGSLWDLKGYKGVGQFEAASPEVFTNPLMVYLRLGAQITQTPLYRIDPSGSIPSGESRRVAEAPFVAKAEDRSERFEDTWEELVTFALQVVGQKPTSVDVQWAPTQDMDDSSAWATLQAKLDAGLPPQQAFVEIGYSSDQVEEWFGEDESGDLESAAELLLKIGQALSSLGTAVSLGSLSEVQLAALIAAIMGDPDDDGSPGLPLPMPTPDQAHPAPPAGAPGALPPGHPGAPAPAPAPGRPPA